MSFPFFNENQYKNTNLKKNNGKRIFLRLNLEKISKGNSYWSQDFLWQVENPGDFTRSSVHFQLKGLDHQNCFLISNTYLKGC